MYVQKLLRGNVTLKHMIKHFGEMQIQCDVFEKSFKRKCSLKSALKLHRISHSGERPFQCDLFERSYKRSSELKENTIDVMDNQKKTFFILDNRGRA